MASFGFVEIVLDDAIYPAAARPAAQTLAKIGQVFDIARRDYFHVAVFCVAYPSAQFQLTGFAMNKPAEAHSLHTALN